MKTEKQLKPRASRRGKAINMECLRQFIIDKTTAYEWRSGDRIPDMRSLAKRFDISSGSAGKVVREMADIWGHQRIVLVK